jgi:hypothetical protein
MSFDGECALTTGSSRGTGRGIALKLAELAIERPMHDNFEVKWNGTCRPGRASGVGRIRSRRCKAPGRRGC